MYICVCVCVCVRVYLLRASRKKDEITYKDKRIKMASDFSKTVYKQGNIKKKEKPQGK